MVCELSWLSILEEILCMNRKSCIFFSGIVIISCIISAVYAIFCNEPYNDVACRYLPMVKAFTKFQWDVALNINNSVIIPAIGGIIALITGLSPFHSIILSSSIFYILAIFPLYFFLRFFFKDNYNAILLGCLLYVTAPKIIRWGCTGLLDQGRNFFLITSITILLSYFQNSNKRTLKAALLGASLAGLCLVRGEGIGYIPIFLVLSIVFHIREEKKYSLKLIIKFIKPLSICTFVLLLLLTPRLMQVYKATGIISLDGRLSYLLNIQNNNEQSTAYNPDTLTSVAPVSMQTNAISSNIKNSNIGRLSIFDKITNPGWIKNFFQSISSGSYEIYLVLVVIGLMVIVARHSFKFEMIAPLAIVLYSIPLLFVTAVSQRYFSGNILLLMPFTLTGLLFLYELTVKYKIKKIAIIVFIIVLVAQIHNGLNQAYSRNDAYYRLTGQWIVAHKNEFIADGAPLVLLSDMPQFYYWADVDGIDLGNLFGDNVMLPRKDEIEAFKVSAIVVRNRNKDALNALKQCNYLKEIQQPNQDKVGVFVPVK